ncbi:synaptotagmin-15-like isoform X3 [Mercenaria mercenaria]|uniref:synaptotagmin-15-like isoform X2 n=1 Tax=Mercenaria mercenaria TaxID=6596 RepID=UPI001E1D6FC8|nr:synaptotagmin-15-like isoform X2 [Mercenaria mercenaria]XP_045213418.1 synaptotagmin-15-like isoform X3 [Mercenaria mercenaria]
MANNRHNLHKKPQVSSAVVIAGSVLAVVVAVLIIVVVWRLCSVKKRRRSSSYEQIVSQHRKHSKVEIGNLPDGITAMKQIPFMVPQHSCTTPPVGRHTRSEDENYSSEPSSPSSKRPSVEIPGAYALGSIDPSLYRISDEDDEYEIPPDHLGRVWFAVEYERETEKLLVTLIKAKNLPNRTFGAVNGCDPFVRIYLMPDERRYLQSKFKKKTCSPKFEESYVFQVSNRNIGDRVLKLTVYDVDRQKKHHVIGHALYPLKDHDCESNERLVIWRDLEREVLETTSELRGELMVSLSYNNHLERLTVGVYEGRSFETEGSAPIDSYVKVQLMVQNKTIKTKRTEVIKKNANPVFNESFTFKLSIPSLDTANVTITAMQPQTGYKDKVIGKVTIGSFMFARGKELQHWNDMVSNQRDQVMNWHTLVS